MNDPKALHLTTYYKTLEDYAVYNDKAWAKEGKSIRKHLVGAAEGQLILQSIHLLMGKLGIRKQQV